MVFGPSAGAGVCHPGRTGVEQPLDTVAGERLNVAGTQGDAAQAMVDGIGNHRVVAELPRQFRRQQGHALGGFVELRDLRLSVEVPLGAGADDALHSFKIRAEFHQAVMAGVHYQVVAVGELGRFTREAQGARRRHGSHIRAVTAVEGPLGFVLGHEFLKEDGQAVGMALAGEVGNNVASGGSTTTSVGHARAVYAFHVASSGSSRTGWWIS